MLSIERLIWDPGNVAHIAKHRVTIEEVEQVCHSDALIREGYLGRIVLIGSSATGRVLTIVLEPIDERTYYVVTARPADRKERRLYAELKGSQQ